MNLAKEFKLLILPVIKGLPLIVTMVVLGYFGAKYGLEFITPQFEVGAKIKLDNRDHGSKDIELFREDMAGTKGSNFLTEVEVFKTKSLQRKALEKLEFDVSYYRKTEMRKVELYKESPFLIDYKVLDTLAYDEDIFVRYMGEGKFRFFGDEEYREYIHTLYFNKAYTDSTTISYRIRPNKNYLKKHPQSLKVGDEFVFRINNIETLVKGIDNSNFFCNPVDKEVFIVKLYYKHEHPQKAVDFLNTLLKTYIETDGERRAMKNKRIIAFMEAELDSLGREMTMAGLALSAYRRNNNIINPDQETDAILRQLNQFDVSKMTLDMKEIELKNIYEFLKSDRELSSFSPDFEMVKDDVFQHTFLELKKLEIEKFKMSERFPESSTEIQTINAQIKELKNFIFKSIEKKLINIDEQRAEIANTIDGIQSKFESYPEKQRKLAQLERDFLLKEETFNYLTKKKLEVDIANTAGKSHHEIIDYAIKPKRSAFPNSPLIKGAVIFAALLLSLILIYTLNFFYRTVNSVYELKEKLDFPFIGTVKTQSAKGLSREVLLNLYSNILNEGAFEGNKMITISSVEDNEGKTFIAKELGALLADFGKRVLLIDINYNHALVEEEISVNGWGQFLKNTGFQNIIQLFKSITISLFSMFYWTRKLLWFFRGRGKSLKMLMSKTGTTSTNLDYVFLSGDNQELTSSQLFAPQTASFLNEMKQNYDVVLIDTENISRKADAAATMMLSDYNLFVFRKGISRVRKINSCKQFVDSYNLKNIYLVFNGQ